MRKSRESIVSITSKQGASPAQVKLFVAMIEAFQDLMENEIVRSPREFEAMNGKQAARHFDNMLETVKQNLHNEVNHGKS